MQKVRGYEFFKVDPDTGVFLTLDPAIDRVPGPTTGESSTTSAQDASQLLRQRSEPEPGEGKPAVIADTTFDLQREYEEVKRDLLRYGYTVRPGERLPLVASQLETFVREQLADCRLSIHLVGRKWGIVPEESEESLVALQNALAAQCSEGGTLERLIWLPPGLQPADEQQKRLVEALRRDNRNHLGADLLETSLEDLKTVVHQRLEGARTEIRREGPTDLVRVYLVRDRRDEEEAAALEQRLLDHPASRSSRPCSRAARRRCAATTREPGDLRRGADLWRGQRALAAAPAADLIKSSGYGRLRKLLASAIYVAPPATPQKERLRCREAVVLRPDTEPTALDAFLRSIGDARPATPAARSAARSSTPSRGCAFSRTKTTCTSAGRSRSTSCCGGSKDALPGRGRDPGSGSPRWCGPAGALAYSGSRPASGRAGASP
jgi:hypothetical protein